MTLSTHVRLHVWPSIGERGVLDWINRELLGARRMVRTSERPGSLANEPEQGFAAWVILEHNDGAHIVDDVDEEMPPAPAAYLDIDFDTTYGFRDETHASPAILHADFIVRLQNRFGDLSWRNEFDGSWHHGLEGLADFIGSGDAAEAWFGDIVKPALTAAHPDIIFPNQEV
jgi:hypothetical protein